MTPFAPTHEIVVTSTTGFLTGVVERIPVMRDEDVLYTESEWANETQADWTLKPSTVRGIRTTTTSSRGLATSSDELRWQGQSAGLYAVGHTVELIPVRAETVAEFCGKAWGKEMVDQGARAETGAGDSERVADLENCDFGALVDDLEAAGLPHPRSRDDWRHLVTVCCKAALAYVKEHGERDEDDAALPDERSSHDRDHRLQPVLQPHWSRPVEPPNRRRGRPCLPQDPPRRGVGRGPARRRCRRGGPRDPPVDRRHRGGLVSRATIRSP